MTLRRHASADANAAIKHGHGAADTLANSTSIDTFDMIDPIFEQANAAFPNIAIQLQGRRQRFVTSRRIGRYSVTLFRSPATSVDVIGRRAVGAGLGNRFKLIWQLSGRMRVEGERNKFDIGPGELLVTSMADDYQLSLLESHEALILTFDPEDDPMWSDLARQASVAPTGSRSGIAASAQGVLTLLSAPTDGTGEFAAHTMINLALLSTQRAEHNGFSSRLVARAALQVQRNLSDVTYGPVQLARDLGMSRRSLYTRMAEAGTTPAALVGQVRLAQAKDDIQRSPARSLLDIALVNGFRDGACFSRAFRRAFGHPPSWFRREN